MRPWVYAAATAVIAALIAVWAIPFLGDDSGQNKVWIDGGALLGVSLATHIDSLAASVLLLAAGVAVLVQIYSLAYLKDHRRYRSYALIIVLFLLAMATVAASDDLFVLLVGWEVMGACSYLLISQDWEKSEARAGAAKAFVMTRVADLGLLLGIIMIGQAYGTYRISAVLEAVAAGGAEHADAVALLLLLAVVGKSAQFPLHTWLPDAMPGPTPITALIHAATMVAAGVYLVARLLPLFAASAAAMTVLALIAAITMVLGAVCALTRDDLKRALAWSTVGQLAYMFAALSVGVGDAATDHLLAHGVFKALLFLGCGSVMLAVGSSALHALGGLRVVMPFTFWTSTIGFAALAGVVPTSGFFSKDGVLEALWQARDGETAIASAVAWVVLIAALITAFLTAWYCFRWWHAAFFGARSQSAREAPLLVTGPLVILAVAVFALSFGQPLHLGMAVASSAIALAGFGTAWRLRTSDYAVPRLLVSEFGIDHVWSRLVPATTFAVSRTVVVLDANGVDSYSRGLSRLANLMSSGLRLVQSGNVQRYATLIASGVVVLVALAVILP